MAMETGSAREFHPAPTGYAPHSMEMIPCKRQDRAPATETEEPQPARRNPHVPHRDRSLQDVNHARPEDSHDGESL